METYQYKPLILFVALLLASVSLQAADPNLTVISSSRFEFSFSYSFDDEIDQALASEFPLRAENLQRVVQIALPPGSEARLVAAQGLQPESAPSVSADADYPLTELSAVSLVRGRSTVGVKISPVQAGTIYRTVQVQIQFDRGRDNLSLSTEADPLFDRVWAHSLANYEVAANWARMARQDERSTLASTESATILASSSSWFQIKITEFGLVAVTGSMLSDAGISLTGLASDDIRMFSIGGKPLPLDNATERPELQEVALLIQDGGDGSFGAGDRFFFLGEAVDRWLYNETGGPRFLNNPYTEENVYWLTVSGSFPDDPVRMTNVDGTPTGTPNQTVTRAWRRIHLEQDHLIATESDGHIWNYYDWFWSTETSFQLSIPTLGVVPSSISRIHVQGKTSQDIDLWVNGLAAIRTDCSHSRCQFEARNLRGQAAEQNQFDLVLEPVGIDIPPFLDYVEVEYWADLLPIQNVIDFSLDSLSGATDVAIGDDFTTEPVVLDVTDPLRPQLVSGFTRTGGALTFRTHLTPGIESHFYVAPLAQASPPRAIEEVTLTDPRSFSGQTDVIVVTTRNLAPALSEYLNYRAAEGYSFQTVAVEDIQQCFSYGMIDPTGIRDFLKYAYENYPAPAPAVALFVGDASYDYMDHLGTGVENLVPSYVRPGDRAYSDDNYVYFGTYGILDSDGDRGFDMMTARWPVRTASEINTIVGKLRDYESPSSAGTWRTRMALVADDEHTRDQHTEIFHTTQTETLEKQYVPRYMNRNKIYLWEYPFVNVNKPEVNSAIVEAFNQGSLVVNYVGHGNPDVWSHEQVFQRAGDLPRLRNGDRLPLVYAASCDIGFFDDPAREGMAEDLLALPNAGAIGVISATRLVYAADNAQFNRAVYTNLFGDPDLTICEAMFAAKLQRQYPSPQDTIPRPVQNDRAYNFLGDPLLRLAIPSLRVEFNERPDSLKALELSRLAGRLVDREGAPQGGNGTLYVTIYDSDMEQTYRLANDAGVVNYNVSGPTIFRGTATIVNGAFDMQFVTPLDVGYRGASARISAYAMVGDQDGIGLVDSLPVSESQAVSNDVTGPIISFAITGRDSFESGDRVSQDESLEVTVSDPSGVNLVGGLGHGITLTIDGDSEAAVNLTDNFEAAENDFTTGGLVYPLAGMTPGEHRLKLKAWDNANNVAVVQFDLHIGSGDQFVVSDLLNYPNPMADSTAFYFGLSQPAARVDLEIYTTTGKTIWSTSRYGLQADYYPNSNVSIVWDGHDDAGDRVASGVYIYRLVVEPTEVGDEITEFGKVIVLN